jgi:hypothetical protein
MGRRIPEELCVLSNQLSLFSPSFSEEDKVECLKNWSCSSNLKPWLVGISSLLMGIDYANIKHVVFFEGFYSNLDLIQGYFSLILHNELIGGWWQMR